MPPQEDVPRVPAVLTDMLLKPSHQRGDVLNAGRKLRLRREPVVGGDTDQIVGRGPAADVVVERRAFGVFVAAGETAAIDEYHHRFACSALQRDEDVGGVA